MIQTKPQPNVGFIISFMGFFLATYPASLSTYWLLPQIVLSEAFLWAVLAIFTIWILISTNSLALFLKILRKNWLIFPFLLFAGLSIFWSIYEDISVYRWLVLIFTIVVGGYIGLQYSLKEFTRSLTIFGTFLLVISFLLVVFVPEFGVMNYHSIQGAWKGMFWHKNHLGLMVTFINILYLFQLINSIYSKERSKYVYGFLYILSLFFLYKTDSVAALLTTVALHGILFLAMIWLQIRKKLRKYHYLALVIVALIALSILDINIDHFFGIFNRNSSLTGRIPMWTYLYETYISKHPLQGYGFNAFWYKQSMRVDLMNVTGYPDQIVVADNGFIDLVVNTGIIGLALFVIFYIGVWWRSIRFLRKVNGIFSLFPLIFMAFTLLANISWSLIFENESFFFLSMISILFCITKSEVQEEVQSNFVINNRS